MPYSNRFADEVRRAIGTKSQRAIATKMGTSQTMIANMLGGRIPEDYNVVRKFAMAVGEDPDTWEQNARFWATEVQLRTEHDLTDEDVEEVRRIIEKRIMDRRKGD